MNEYAFGFGRNHCCREWPCNEISCQVHVDLDAIEVGLSILKTLNAEKRQHFLLIGAGSRFCIMIGVAVLGEQHLRHLLEM